jgi:hypothetical protein
MANTFELHWGSGEPGTVAAEHRTEGPNRRPQGIPLITLVASFLDPRFKIGPGLAPLDKEYIWSVILHQMVGIERTQRALRRAAEEDEQQQQRDQQQQQQQANVDEGPQDDIFNNMFDDLNALRREEADQLAAQHEMGHHGGEATDRARAELTMYKAEPSLPLQREDRSYNNPLEWWRLKAQQFPLLSELAIRYLCIPATSAPSERVFSSAGLTIAKERSRLDPSTANELVFLHETTPAWRRYNAGN